MQTATGESGNTSRVPFYRSMLFFALLALGIAGNLFRYDIFFNIEFVFGSIFAFLALLRFGLLPGVIAGAVISSSTYVLWNHPYAILIMTAEVFVAGMLARRRTAGVVLADALYWIFIGMPLVLLFYHVVMDLPLPTASITMLKQATNGIANALAARLLFTAASPRWRREQVSMREALFDLLVLFCLVPALFLIAKESRDELAEADQSVREALVLSSQRIGQTVNAWLDQRIITVEQLAWLTARMPVNVMQKYLEQVQKGDRGFLRMGLLDRDATIIAYSPLLDEMKQSNIGRNFRDRPFIPALKQTLKPMLSEVVMGRIGAPGPMAAALAPVVVQGGYHGYVTGILDLEKLDALIALMSRGSMLVGREYILLDQNNKVILGSRKGLVAMTVYSREPGDVMPLDRNIYRRVPLSARNVPVIDRWKKAVYSLELPLGGMSRWRLILEQPLAPYQEMLYERYAVQLAWIFGILLAALAIAEIMSRRLTVPLGELGALSSGLPARLVRGESVTWPETAVRETRLLIDNMREMASELANSFTEVQALNATLEQRIHERTRELKASEERFRFLYEKAPLGMGFMTPDGVITGCNDTHVGIIGTSREKIVGFNMLHDAADPSLRRAVAEALAGRLGVFEGQYTARTSGRTLYLRSIFAPLSIDESGKVGEIMFLADDITERTHAETALADSEKKYRQLIESLQEGIWLLDREGNTTFANPKMAQMLGYSVEEMLGRHLFSFMDERSRSIAARQLEDRRKGLREQHDFEFLHKNGSRIFATVAATPIMDEEGTYAGALAGVMNITERKQAEDDLKRTRATLAEAQKIAHMGSFEYFPDTQTIVWSEEQYLIHGFNPSEPSPTVDEILTRCILPAERAVTYEVFSKAVQSESIYELEHRILWPDGSIHWVYNRAYPYFDQQGRLLRYLGITLDITERKRAEKELQEKTRQLEDLTKNLEQRVQNEIALRLKNEQLLIQQSKMAAMGEMLGAIAHQWRQPLNILGLIIQNLQDAQQHGELDAAYLERAIDKSMAQIDRMSRTIDDFRNFFLPDKERTSFDAMQSVGDVLSLLSAQLAASGIDFRLICRTHETIFTRVEEIVACPRKTVAGFRNEFEHVIMNLISNAREAILERRGAGRMRGDERGLLIFEFRVSDGMVCIEVRDNGGGMPEDVLDRIFEPYFTTKGPAKGTGLGLYMSKVIVEDHMHGKLSARNGDNGAVFTIELPQP